MSVEADRQRHTARVILAYHRVFNSPDGKMVAEDLSRAFGWSFPAFIPNATTGALDPYLAAMRDGQRSVNLHILAKLAAVPVADGNVKPKRKVKKEPES